MTKVKTALIGYGHLGKWHAQKAETLNMSELVAIVDPFEKSQELARENYPNVKVVSDIKEVIDEIDAVLIVTPTSFHFEVAKEMIKAGKHIFCEKPVTETLAQAKELKELLQDKVFQVGHSERCHQAWELLGDYNNVMKNAKIVNIRRVSDFKGRAADVSVVEDLMIHDLDLALMLFGKPDALEARGAKAITDKWDHAYVSMFYEDGKVVNIENSRMDLYVERSVQVISDHGNLKVDLFKNTIDSTLEYSNTQAQQIKSVNYEKRDHLLIEQEKFYRSILHGDDTFVSLDDGILAINLIEKVNKSLEEGKRVEV